MRRQITVFSAGFVILLLVASGLAQSPTPSMGETAALADATPMSEMGGMSEGVDVPRLPPVTGYSEGEVIHFVHSETSDTELARTLTQMMGGSPVLVVPALAEVPESTLATVYAFTNGVMPEMVRGPLGFQPDVFDNPPGTEAYSPLRAVSLVTWNDRATPRVLTSAAEVEAAAERGEITVEETSIIVNMPFLTWPGGQR